MFCCKMAKRTPVFLTDTVVWVAWQDGLRKGTSHSTWVVLSLAYPKSYEHVRRNPLPAFFDFRRQIKDDISMIAHPAGNSRLNTPHRLAQLVLWRFVGLIDTHRIGMVWHE